MLFSRSFSSRLRNDKKEVVLGNRSSGLQCSYSRLYKVFMWCVQCFFYAIDHGIQNFDRQFFYEMQWNITRAKIYVDLNPCLASFRLLELQFHVEFHVR